MLWPNLIPQGKFPAPTKPWRNWGNWALTGPGCLASFLLIRSSSVVCKSPNPSAAHGGEQTQQHQRKDWQPWFILKCFLPGWIVSIEKMQVASSDKKGFFFFFFFLFAVLLCPSCGGHSYSYLSLFIRLVGDLSLMWDKKSCNKCEYPKEGIRTPFVISVTAFSICWSLQEPRTENYSPV